LLRTRPDLVYSDEVGDHVRLRPGREPRAYNEALADLLTREYGVCAQAGAPEDEVAVKTSNSESWNFDSICCGQENRVWLQTTVRCSPARFD